MKTSKAFTLIEILLAMLISAILVLGMHAAFRQALLIWSKTEGRRPAYQDARYLTELFRNELSSLYMPPSDEEEGNSFELLTLPEGAVELSFYTLNPSYRGGIASNLMSKVTYQFINESNEDFPVLLRSEQLCSGEKIVGTIEETPRVIANNIAELKLWAYVTDPDTGQGDWEQSHTSKDIPPKALRISLSLQAKGQEKIDFKTSILIHCQGAITQ